MTQKFTNISYIILKLFRAQKANTCVKYNPHTQFRCFSQDDGQIFIIRRPGNSQLKKTFYFSFKAFLNIKTNKTFQESQPILVHFYHLDLKKRGEILPCQFLDLTFRQFHVEAEKNKISLLWVSGTQTYEWPESHFIIPHALK